jgi:cardiolipin synthase
MLLHENIYTIPNMLTLGRLIAAPYVGYLIIQHEYPLALGVFVAAGLTDMVIKQRKKVYSTCVFN